jgi:hypothetical protein
VQDKMHDITIIISLGTDFIKRSVIIGISNKNVF